jgi:2-polyprenyl-3-methyl-5-hydroxy-6-metoxy-1,4-benzoquinol methylase
MFTNIYTKGKYLDISPNWFAEESSWKAEQILNILSRNCLQPLTICEIGCGAGEILKKLHDELDSNINFCGWEISPQAFDLCKQNENDRLKFYLGDFFVEDNSMFDLILCIDVFEHIENYYGFLKDLKHKSKYQIFHIPLDLYVANILRCKNLELMRYSIGHIHSFTKETALASLKDTGYEIIDCSYTNYAVETPTKSLNRKLAKIPRKLFGLLNADLAARVLGGYELLVLTTAKE